MTTPRVYVDFETRSRADLETLGGRLYAEHPSTEVLCAVTCLSHGGRDEWRELHGRFTANVPAVFDAVAHNGINFDRHVWRRLGWPEPRKWIDTMELARVAGFPEASLEWLGANLLHAAKDLEGNKLTVSLSKPELFYGPKLHDLLGQEIEACTASAVAESQRLITVSGFDAGVVRSPAKCKAALQALGVPVADTRAATLEALRPALSGGARALVEARLGLGLVTAAKAAARDKCIADLDARGVKPAPVPADVLARVTAYCRKDVELMVRLHREWLEPWEGSDLEGLEEADRAVIDRGVYFDRELAELLLIADETLRDQALEAAGVTDTAELGPIQLKATLASLGAVVDDCTADTIEALLVEATEAGEERIAALCRARQALSSIAAGKLRAGLARCSSDGRLRDNTRYYGAHTGRWSGSGMQLQNMAAGADIDVAATIELLNAGELSAVYWKENT